MRAHQHRWPATLATRTIVAHRLLEGAKVADGQQRVLLLHEQRGGRQPRGLVGLGVAGVLDPRDDLVDVVPTVEVALVGREPRQEAVRRLDLALGLGAARAAQLQLEAGGLGELVCALDLEAPAALDRHQGGHVVRDPLAGHAAEPRDRGVHASDQVVGRPGPRPDEYVPAGMAQRRREHVELEQLAIAVRHPDRLLPVELQLQPGRRLEARMRFRAAGGPDGDAVLAHELGEGVVAGQVLAGIPVQQPLVDALLGDPRQLRLGGHLLDVRVEGARPVGAPVAGSAALGPPVRRHGVPVLAVALRYVAEVGLNARFPVTCPNSPIRFFSATARSSRKHRSLVGRSVSPGVGGNGENALARLGKLRWRNRLMCDGEIGCFYSSANIRRRRRHAGLPVRAQRAAGRRRRRQREGRAQADGRRGLQGCLPEEEAALQLLQGGDIGRAPQPGGAQLPRGRAEQAVAHRHHRVQAAQRGEGVPQPGHRLLRRPRRGMADRKAPERGARQRLPGGRVRDALPGPAPRSATRTGGAITDGPAGSAYARETA